MTGIDRALKKLTSAAADVRRASALPTPVPRRPPRSRGHARGRAARSQSGRWFSIVEAADLDLWFFQRIKRGRKNLSAPMVKAGERVTATVTLTAPARAPSGGVTIYVGFDTEVLAGPREVRIPNSRPARRSRATASRCSGTPGAASSPPAR